MTIFDIAKSISWTDENYIFLSPKDDKHEFICEYVSNVSLPDIHDEIENLKKTDEAIRSNNKDTIERHFLENLVGFDKGDKGIYAYVSGAHEFSAQIIYHLETNSTFLKPAITYGEWEKVDLQTVIILLEDLKQVSITIQGRS